MSAWVAWTWLLVGGVALAQPTTPVVSKSPVYNRSAVSLVGQDVRLDAKVVFVDLPVSGRDFQIGWEAADGKTYWYWCTSSAGLNAYDPRIHPKWQGVAARVGLKGWRGARPRLARPSLAEELRLLLTAEHFNFKNINFVREFAFFGHPFWAFSLVVAALAAVMFRVTSRATISGALVLGTMVALTAWDLRFAVGRWHGVAEIDTNELFGEFKAIAESSREFRTTIGSGSWAGPKLPGGVYGAFSYQLAEHEHVPEGVVPGFAPKDGQSLRSDYLISRTGFQRYQIRRFDEP